MEKILLKPQSQEITIKNDEPGIFFDAFSYSGSNLQEKNLGSLFIIGQVKYGEENLGYLVNLISSLAKREYYAKAFSQDQNPRSAFEDTLKKLNEVLEDFFKNKQFKLAVGLASIAGENILISRIGNIRVSMARNGDYIDVLNNIELFDKEHIEEKEFSNVISGKVQSKDKLFMYLPLKTVTSREKSLREVFKKEPQAVFAEKLNNLSQTAANFACCGIHMEINSIKEIPVQSRPSYSTPATPRVNMGPSAQLASEQTQISPKTHSAVEVDSKDDEEDTRKDLKGYKDLPQPHIIPADVSLVHRKNVMATLTGFLGNVNPGPFIKKRPNRIKMLGGALVVLALVVVGAYFLVFHKPANYQVIKDAQNNLKLAQDKISQNDNKSARSLLASALSSLDNDQTSSATTARDNLNKLLGSIDKTSDKTPTMLWDLSAQGKLNNILVSAEGVFVLGADGNFSSVDNGSLKAVAKLSIQNANLVFDGSKDALLLNTDAHGSIINKTNGKSSDYSLDKTTDIKNGAIYADNLYALSGGSIVKFADATLGKSTGAAWSKETVENAQAIAADGNIYVLTTDGKLQIYFTGEKKSDLDLGVSMSSDANLFTLKDLPFVYLIDKSNKKVMVFDKSNGALQTTYSLSNVGSVADVSITKDQAIYILSGDNKVWQIK